VEKMGLNPVARQVNKDFWRGKRVLITGHTGFKGSWLSLWLQSMNVNIRGIGLGPPTAPALFSVARVAEKMESSVVDIRDFAAVKMQIEDFKPEIIIHMAAQSLVLPSYDDPVETYSTNVMGTVHILEAARRVESVKAIVNITSDKCYQNREWVWGYREDEPMGGHDPYSNSKGCAELVSAAYRESFLDAAGIQLATARAGNVIGGGDWAPNRLVPDALRALQERRPVLIRSPNAIRPWQHVLEPLSGYLLLAERLFLHGQLDAQGWNFGPRDEDARPVRWVVERLCESWGGGGSWTLQAGKHPHEASFLKLDISKARNRLQWAPRWALETALKYVTEWHQAWLHCQDMRAVCLKQINDYESTP
jgi:CDP-glucose 4,6-dehydratase